MDNINAVATEKDVLFHLGDFCFIKKPSDIEALVASINPRIILIYGNHDRRKTLAKGGLTIAGEEAYLTYKGKTLWLGHFPAIRSQYDIENNRQCPRKKPIKPYDVLLHGHRHAETKEEAYRTYEGKPHLDIGVDANMYRPYSIEEVLQLC